MPLLDGYSCACFGVGVGGKRRGGGCGRRWDPGLGKVWWYGFGTGDYGFMEVLVADIDSL